MNLTLIWPYNPQAIKIPELFPIGLGYLAANLDKEKIEVSVLDCTLRNLHPDNKEFIDELKRLSPDLVGISWWSSNTPSVMQTIKVVKSTLPKAVIIAGGPHTWANGSDLITDNLVDYVFYGESEIGFLQFLNLIRSSAFKKIDSEKARRIEGLIYRNEFGKIVKNPQNILVDLDKLGIVDYELLNLEGYVNSGYRYGGKVDKEYKPSAPIVTTRGCPYKCNFCSASRLNGNKLRKHSIEYIIGNIKSLYERHNIRHISILDDNFTFDVKWAEDVCRAIVGLGLEDLVMSTPNGIRINRMTESLARAMAEAGWKEIVIAPESGSQKTLKAMNKRLDLKRVPLVVDMFHRVGLKVDAFFILGYPSETMEDLLLTEKFIAGNDFDNIHLHIFQPLPGTPIFERLVEEGVIDKDFIPGEYQQVTFKPENLAIEEVKDIYNRILSNFRDSRGIEYASKNVASVRE